MLNRLELKKNIDRNKNHEDKQPVSSGVAKVTDKFGHSIAHDLNDPSKTRSKDVVLEENVTFPDLMLAPKTCKGLERCGFVRPSPIQLETIPLGRCGFDLIVQSKAGTGKTCIFTLVALEALRFNPKNCTQTLILAPTREIAIQTHEVITFVGSEHKNLHIALCIGGVFVREDRAKFTRARKENGGSCQIVVGTPGRVKQLIDLNVIRTENIELFVLDEADELIDEQFKKQIDNIYKRLPVDKQMIVTSATYPDELSSFLAHYMRDPKCVRMGKEISLEAVEEFYLESKAGHSTRTTMDNKLQTLKLLLKTTNFSKCIIFTNFQTRAPIICECLNKDETLVDDLGKTNYICAELTQEARCNVFNNFKNSDQKILVSTDISARGIDIHGVELVINLDLPTDKATYYHRIGRAGRFGQPGRAISIVADESLDRAEFEKSIRSPKINKLTIL